MQNNFVLRAYLQTACVTRIALQVRGRGRRGKMRGSAARAALSTFLPENEGPEPARRPQ